MIKVNDLIVPKDYPELKSRVTQVITHSAFDETLYVVEGGMRYTRDEIKTIYHLVNDPPSQKS